MIHVIGSDDTSLLHLSRFLGVLLEYLFFTLLYVCVKIPCILTQTSAFSAFSIFRTGSSLVTCPFFLFLRRHKADFNLPVYVTHGRCAKQHKNVDVLGVTLNYKLSLWCVCEQAGKSRFYLEVCLY